MERTHESRETQRGPARDSLTGAGNARPGGERSKIIDPELEREILPDIEHPPQPPQLATLERLGTAVVVTVTVTDLSGGEATELVSQLLHVAETSETKHFVFDLQNVSFMDSSCVGAMVELLTILQKQGGRIAIVNAAQSVSYLFKLTRLDRLFPICRDVPTAVAAVERAGSGAPKKKSGWLW